MRRALPALLAAMVGLSLPMGEATAAPPADKPAPRARKAKPEKADANRDKVFDDLEEDLAQRPDDARVNVLVLLNGDASEERVRGLKRRSGEFSVGHRYAIVDGFSATMTKGQVRAVARDPDVVHVEEDSPVRATNDSAQAAFGVTAARAATAGLDGAGVKVAVIDTGIAASHADLGGSKVVAFKDYVAPPRRPTTTTATAPTWPPPSPEPGPPRLATPASPPVPA